MYEDLNWGESKMGLSTLYVSCMWLGVAQRMDTKKTCISKRLDCMLRI